MTRARDLADMISSGKIELAEIATSTQESLGNTDLYGFKKTNGTGSQKEDLILTKTNGSDNISVATNDGSQTDLYDESFFSKKGLTFSVNSDGELLVTV
jgi:hypothetical protein|nr:hypothetical protein [uncultured Mediterranean phage uvMED]|tara:strand:+ start:63 stop:359 length:297 start_codon:yes stop_codon:yes gene_type:complete